MTNSWIWTSRAGSRNAFVRFRRKIRHSGTESMLLRVSADSRYWVFLNGERLGFGPVRSWPNHWKYDEYDISAQLKKGENVIAVLVNHYGEGNFQYLAADPGLWVELHRTAGRNRSECVMRADAAWRVDFAPAFASRVPRISVQEGFEEQFDARHDDGWTLPGYDDRSWSKAKVVPAPHPFPEPSGIPHLTAETVFPQRILRAEVVRPADYTWTLNVKPYFAPNDLSSNIAFVKGYLFTKIWSARRQVVTFIRPHHHSCHFFVNGRKVPGIQAGMTTPLQPQKIVLREGWNTVLFPYPGFETSEDGIKTTGAVHLAQFVLCVRCAAPLKWSTSGGARRNGATWAFVGPYSFTPDGELGIRNHMDFPRLVLAEKIGAEATWEAFAEIFQSGELPPSIQSSSIFQELRDEDVYTADAGGSAFADEVIGRGEVSNPDALLSGNSEWCHFPVPKRGCDLRLLVDFGKEIVGHQDFEVDAPEGAIIDFHNFEFIQPDGRENYADGMNNSFRYVCREGRQTFQTLQRRGFQYCWVIVRRARRPVRFRRIAAEFSSYPQSRKGSFSSSDALLNRIWEVGAHTLRCCAEDTYTDCPSYEQTHWVGDARNEALADWVINGDPRLWFRCIEQTAQSLERSPITLSQVPSAWDNILPAWSFFWMRSCREYLLWTGDYAGARKLFPWILRNVEGVRQHINERGLFEIQGWNMFDWADMDTPPRGVITHLNCFAVLALRDCAQLAEWLGERRTGREFLSLAEVIASATNRHLWKSDEHAYADCLHEDGRLSEVFSQQTQTVALASGVATGSRGRHCREHMYEPPAHFVKAGSPGFEFLLLEMMAAEGKYDELLETIRRDWGFMIEKGATTFWEMWSLKRGRLTRSHCHGWSAAPTFFLSQLILGVTPTKPGFAEVKIDPRLGGLLSTRGVMPTPKGPIEIDCTRKDGVEIVRAAVPRGIRVSRDSVKVLPLRKMDS